MDHLNTGYQSLPRDHGLPRDQGLPRDHRSGLVSRLGKFAIALFTFSFALCLGCLAFFTFLWTSDSNNNAWRTIILAGWTTRSITIASLCLRWATASQAITCTSMLAAILLQKQAVPLRNAAFLSVMRFDNTGPWTLLYRMASDWNPVSSFVGFLLALLCITTLSLQFTSTVLLSQVGIAYLPVSTSVAQRYYGIDPDGLTFISQLGEAHTYIQTTPVGFPAFAEWSSNATNSNITAQQGEIGPNTSPGIRDTGTVMRAFLPFGNADERSRLTEYQGYATVVDTRVVCMRPKLSNTAFTHSNDDGYRLAGRAVPQVTPLDFRIVPDVRKSNNITCSFKCGFDVANYREYSETEGWPIAMCRCLRSNSKLEIVSVMEPDETTPFAGIFSVTEPDETKPDAHRLSKSYILINATSTEFATDSDNSDLWTSMTLSRGPRDAFFATNVTFQVTLCMTVFQPQEMEILATRPSSAPSEPTLFWNTSIAAYNTTNVQRQLLVHGTKATVTERGLFDLKPRSWKRDYQPGLRALRGVLSTTQAISNVGKDSLFLGMVNRAQYSIFTQMARFTSDPAAALQAYFTTWCAVSYYDKINQFDQSAPSSQVSLVDVIRPLGWAAYAAVLGMTIFHLLLVLTTTLIFKRAGKLSRIGSAWTAVSQLLGPTTEGWIKEADMINDKSVKLWLETHELDAAFVRLEEVQGRVQLVSSIKR